MGANFSTAFITSRINESVELALQMSQGLISVLRRPPNKEQWEEELFSENFTCPEHGMLLSELSPRVFSFNSPFGACERCNGLGVFLEPDEKKIIPDENLSFEEGVIQACYEWDHKRICRKFRITASTRWSDLSQEQKNNILNGTSRYEGIIPTLLKRFYYSSSESQKKTYSRIYVN